MRTNLCLGIAAAALAIALQASPASAFWGMIGAGVSCSDDWPTWKKVADPAGYLAWKAGCLDSAGTGSGENLKPLPSAVRKGNGYKSDPSKGFGSDIPVTLPPDRRPAGGKNSVNPYMGSAPQPVNVLAPRRPVIR
jgi:hypothetical protein